MAFQGTAFQVDAFGGEVTIAAFSRPTVGATFVVRDNSGATAQLVGDLGAVHTLRDLVGATRE